jgi:hypothetical protein
MHPIFDADDTSDLGVVTDAHPRPSAADAASAIMAALRPNPWDSAARTPYGADRCAESCREALSLRATLLRISDVAVAVPAALLQLWSGAR